MSALKLNGVQIGQSVTATNNFTIYQPTVPDGTVRIGNGNIGVVTDRITIDASGNISPGVTNTQTLGIPGDVWSNVYATTFTGALSGNASTVTNGVYTNAANTFTGTNAFNGTTIHTIGNVVSTYTGYFQLGGRGIRKTTTGSNIEIINNANTVVTHTLTDAGDFTAAGNVTAYSDIRLKKDLVQIPDALNKVHQLTGYTYTRIDTGERQTGVVAQDVQKVLPEAVMGGENLSVAYGNMIGLLVEAIKELNTKVSVLEAELRASK